MNTAEPISRKKPGPAKVIVDLKDYMRTYKSNRRAIAIAEGICVHCFCDPATEGMRTCLGCREASR